MRITKNFGTLLCAALCACGGVYAQSPRVSGTFRSPSDTLYYRYFNLSDRSRDAEDQVEVYAPDGKFAFDLPDGDAVYAILMVPKIPMTESSRTEAEKVYRETMGSMILFEVFPGEQAEITDGGNSVGVSSPTYRKYEEMQRVLQGYREAAKQFGLKGGMQDSVGKYEAKVRETVLDYIGSHPADMFSAFLIKKEVPDADARDAYDMLDASLREGKIGAYVSDAVKNKEGRAQRAENARKMQEAEQPQREAAAEVYAAAKKKQLEAGDPFPELVFTDIEGNDFTLGGLKGKYVYIDVWATWCGPCRGEIPSLKKMEESLAGKNIAFVSISTDSDRAVWEETVEKEGLGGIQLYAGGAKEAFGRFFGITGIPRFILLDRDGKVLDADMGRPSDPGTEKALRALEGI